MNRAKMLILVVACLAGLFAVVASARHASNATDEADAAERLMRECAAAHIAIKSLESQSERVFLTVPENDDVQQQIVQTLSDLGISRGDSSSRADALQGVADGGTKPIRSASGTLPHRRREMTVTLHPLSLTHLGEFLAEWRNRSPAWVPTDLSLTAFQSRGRSQSTTPLYSASITLTSLYLPDGADS